MKFRSLKTQKTIFAGQPGTKKWIKKFGEDLVYVRYKYDPVAKIKMKTVELVIECQQWRKDIKRIPSNKIMNLKVNYEEISVRKLIRSAGGKWNWEKKVWQLPYREAISLGLADRIIN